MNMARGSGAIGRLGLLLGVLLALQAHVARADYMAKRMSLEELTDASAAIVIGQVKMKDSVFADGVVQTKYTLAVSQVLKGKAVSTLEITQVGGSVEGLPFQQKVTGQPTLFKGEKVLLFLGNARQSQVMKDLRARKRASQEQLRQRMMDQGQGVPRFRTISEDHPLATSLGFIGGWQGRFTVFTDEATGREMAVQVGEVVGQNADSEAAFEALQALKGKQPAEGEPAEAPAVTTDAESQFLEEFLAPTQRRQTAMPLEVMKNQIRLHLANQSK